MDISSGTISFRKWQPMRRDIGVGSPMDCECCVPDRGGKFNERKRKKFETKICECFSSTSAFLLRRANIYFEEFPPFALSLKPILKLRTPNRPNDRLSLRHIHHLCILSATLWSLHRFNRPWMPYWPLSLIFCSTFIFHLRHVPYFLFRKGVCRPQFNREESWWKGIE